MRYLVIDEKGNVIASTSTLENAKDVIEIYNKENIIKEKLVIRKGE